MTIARASAHLFILAYISVLISAFVYAMTRTTPLWPEVVFRQFYAMMAPYQSDIDDNVDIVAEGLRSGQWVPIDLNPYFPQGRGEANMRKQLKGVWSLKGEEAQKNMYKQFATELKALEALNNRSYSAVRLFRDTWPKSHEGFEALHTPERTAHDFLIQVP